MIIGSSWINSNTKETKHSITCCRPQWTYDRIATRVLKTAPLNAIEQLRWESWIRQIYELLFLLDRASL
jgi:hypothetical protein